MNRYRVWLTDGTNVEFYADRARATGSLLIFEVRYGPSGPIETVDTFPLGNVLRYRQERP